MTNNNQRGSATRRRPAGENIRHAFIGGWLASRAPTAICLTVAAALSLSACGPVDAASSGTPASPPAAAASSTPPATLVAAATPPASTPAATAPAAVPAPPPAAAASDAAAPTLPGGANSLTEAHQDWTVNCSIIDRSGQKARQCTFSQQLVDSNSKQRTIAIELVPTATGAAGVIDMAFGLALQSGVTLQVDNGAPFPSLPFRTCLPVGCLVSLTVDGKLLTAMRAGTTLKIMTTADGGQPAPFALSLKGFGSALDRTADLLQ